MKSPDFCRRLVKPDFVHPNGEHFRNLEGYEVLHCHPANQVFGYAERYDFSLPLKPVRDRIVKHYWSPPRIQNDFGEWCDKPFVSYYTENQITLVDDDILAIFISREIEQK